MQLCCPLTGGSVLQHFQGDGGVGGDQLVQEGEEGGGAFFEALVGLLFAQGELADVYSEDRRAMDSALAALRAALGEGAVRVQD